MTRLIIHSETVSAAIKDALNAILPGELQQLGKCHVWHHHQQADLSGIRDLSHKLKVDLNCLPDNFDPQQIKLLITDMDSTLINIECVDEIADFAGVKPQVKAITDAAMRGELDFAGSLTQRVALLKGLDQSVLQQVYENRLELNPGAGEMLSCLQNREIKVALVSGGFTFFTDRLKSRLKLDYTRANVLDIQDNRLTGSVLGDIVDAQTKKDFLEMLCEQNAISTTQALAMGDGANDLKMLETAGLGIAYRAKPRVQEQADIVINYSGLDAVCELLA